MRTLNHGRRLRATRDEVEGALAGAMSNTPGYLLNLWGQAMPEEQAVLQRLAHEPEALPNSATVNGLLEQELIELDGDRHVVAVPLFARWIRDNHPLE